MVRKCKPKNSPLSIFPLIYIGCFGVIFITKLNIVATIF